MAFRIVRCEVRWTAKIGISGDELPPQRWEHLGDFETPELAAQALEDRGLTLQDGEWRAPYTYGYVSRYLKEITS